MHKLFFFLFLILVSSLLKAGDLPKLNLEIGKKYLIETIYHIDTSKTNDTREYDKKRFEFEATGFNQREGTYDIRLVLNYFMHVLQEKNEKGEWTEREVYETGYVTTYRNPIVYLNMFQIPVRFKISKENITSSFDFSACSKFKSPEGFPIEIGEWDKKRLIEEVKALFFDSEKTQSNWDHKMDIRSNFRISGEEATKLQIVVDRLTETVQKGNESSQYNHYQRRILIDKTTGLIHEDKLSFVWDFNGEKPITRYQKNISPISEKFEVMQKAGVSEFNKTEIQNPNTSIRISVQDSTEYSRYIYLTYWDQPSNTFKSFRLEKDKKGIFNFQFNISDAQEIFLQSSPESMNISQNESVYLCPGDDIEVEIKNAPAPNRIVFKGSGEEENRVMQTINQLNRAKQGNGSVINLLLRLNQDSVLQILDKEKFNLNPDFYLEISNTAIYSNYLMHGSVMSDSIVNFKIPVFNTLACRNSLYMWFLNQYVSSFIKNNRKFSTNFTNNFDEGIYYSYGQVIFPEPILTEFLSYEVEQFLVRGKWENAKLQYERHKLSYSKNSRFLRTESIYQQEALLSLGMPFPIETLTDVNGEKLNLHSINDKLTIIRINEIFPWRDLAKDIQSWKRYENDFSTFEKNLVFVRIIIGNKDQLAPLKAALADSNSKEINVFQNIEEIYWSKNAYFLLSNKRTIVLGRNGTIIFNRDPIHPEIQNAIEDLKKPSPETGKSSLILKIIASGLMILLFLAGIAFQIFRQVSRRKLKQEELKRKMRELELTVIRTQMNPHFMYNCLNSIQNLVQKNRNEEAHLYLSKFASLVRQALNNSKKNEISLSKEIDSIKEYIELEQLRFEFEFKLDVGNEINLYNIFVPPMLLQPFVENAILHGLISKKTNRILEIRIFKDQNKIELIIEDNGVGREATTKLDGKGNGQGILMSTNRLLLLTEKTGIHYDLKIEDLFDENQNPCGTRVSIGFIEED